MDNDVIIECPKCSWKPDGGHHWMCSCHHLWNTFETAGKCPNCGKSWIETQCPGPGYPGGCGQWSPHIQWYKNLDDVISQEIEEVFKRQRSSQGSKE